MPQVAVTEFDKEKRKFNFLEKMDLPSIPTAGDKIICSQGMGGSYIFKVYDVHYFNNNLVRVNVIRLSSLEEYNASGFSDITYYV